MGLELLHDNARSGAIEAPEVLIADDDLACLGPLAHAFRRLGLLVTSCTSGEEAWAAIQERPRIVIAVLNWMLPELDGHRISRRLYLGGSPVVAALMVGRDFLPEARARMELRAHYILPKPFPQTGLDHPVGHIVRLALGPAGQGPMRRLP